VEFANYVLEQLRRVAPITERRMFGGLGLYSGGRFFAILFDDVLYFKVDDSSRADYERAGMKPFKPFPGRPMTMQYYEVPVSWLEDEQILKARVCQALVATPSNKSKSTPQKEARDALTRKRR